MEVGDSNASDRISRNFRSNFKPFNIDNNCRIAKGGLKKRKCKGNNIISHDIRKFLVVKVEDLGQGRVKAGARKVNLQEDKLVSSSQ